MSALPPLATRDRVLNAVLIVGCGILQAIALGFAAFATRDAFAALHGGQSLSGQTIIELSGAGVIAALCLFVSRRQAEGLGQSYAIALRHVLYAKIASLPKSRHEERRVGALSLRFVGDLSAARLWFGRGLPDVVTAAVVLPGAVTVLVALNPALARVGLAPLALSCLVMGALAWHLEQRHRQLRQRRANIAITMIERIAIAPELDLMGRTRKELRALDRQGHALKSDAMARRGRTAGLMAILQVGVALSGLAMLWFASRNAIPPATVAASLSVLALAALPLQDLGAAWDYFCAWHVAREKALRLLNEADVKRRARRRKEAAPLTVCGEIAGQTLDITAPAGSVTTIQSPNATRLAHNIAGLEQTDGLRITFGTRKSRPQIALIADTHIGLQGSLRRSASLSARRRPDDGQILDVLKGLGLDDLLAAPGGLDQRIAENGKGLSPAQTLRLDLARAVLGQAEIIVIASLRWTAEPDRASLLRRLRHLSQATIILAQSAPGALPAERF